MRKTQLPTPSLTIQLLLFLFGVSVLPLILVGLTSYNASRSVIQEEVSNYTLTLMVEQKKYLELILEQVESLIANISSVEEIKEVLDDEQNPSDDYTRLATQARIGYILNGYTNLKGLASIDIFTTNNVHYHVGDTLNIQNINQETRERIFEEAKAAGDFVLWTGVEENINTNSTFKKVITAAKIFKTREQNDSLKEKVIALLLINYSTDSLYEHFIEVDLGEDSYMMVVDSKNRLIFHPDKEVIGSQISATFLEQLNDEKGSFVTDVENQDMLITYSRSGISDWLLISFVPLKNLTTSADTIRQNTILVLSLCFLFISLIALLVERRVVAPLNRLTELFKEIEAGTFDWTFRLVENRKDEIGELIQWFNAFLDSLEAKRQTEEDKRIAEAANRAKSEFLANMSHELRTPLNGILGYAQILNKEPNLTPRQENGLRVIQRSGDHLLTLINEILDLSKIEAQKMDLELTDFNLSQLLESLADMFQLRAEQKNISFTYERDSDLPLAVHGDEKRLRQVLINLLSNAVKFTNVGGVVLKVDYHEDKIIFNVEDTGIGIPAHALASIFEPFRQVGEQKGVIEGTGLGLAISSKLLKMMGSQLKVSSQLDEGSRFWFELDLPEAVGFTTAAQPPMRIVTGYEGHQRKVLVVDDKWENRLVLLNMLEPLGFSVLEANNGQEALDKCIHHKPDIILLDLRMPVMDGFEAMRRIRKLPNGAEQVIITISASAFEHSRQESLNAGSDDFLAKPFHLQELLDLLGTHLQLTWIYANETEATTASPNESSVTDTQNQERPFIIPPPDQIAILFDFAMRGNVRKISKKVDELEESDKRYAPFATELRTLAKQFKMKEIRAFVKQYMPEGEGEEEEEEGF